MRESQASASRSRVIKAREGRQAVAAVSVAKGAAARDWLFAGEHASEAPDAAFDTCFANPGTSEMQARFLSGRVEAMNETEG